jgi:hypothetical protein
MASSKSGSLCLGGAHRAALTNKFSGRKLNANEQKEPRELVDRIENGDLLKSEEDHRDILVDPTSGSDIE